MHIAINAWFWNRPETGSGQYLRNLTPALRNLDLTLITPFQLDDVPPGVQVHPVELPRGGKLGKALFEQRTVPEAARAVGADLLFVPYWASPLSSPVPVVVTIHDLIPMVLPQYRGGLLARLYTGMVAAAARGAQAIITDSEASRRDILDRIRVDEERVTAIPLAAGPAFQPGGRGLVDMGIRQKYDLPERYVLYLGGFDVRKNVRTLLKAYTYVTDGVGDTVPLLLAGKLPERMTARFDDVQHWIDAMQLGPYVRLLGFVDEADKPTLYREARVFVFPSYYEGFGLPVLEAMACGTPVVASDAASLPEIVGDAGFLVNPNDARRMAGSILANITQESTYKANREAGLARAAEFSWARTADETAAVFEAVVGRGP